jgi:hypothetical protein
MLKDTDLKYSDIQAIQRWVNKKSAETARGINHITEDQLAEGNFLLALIASNMATYQQACNDSTEILESMKNSGSDHAKKISEDLYREMSFRAFLVKMNPAQQPVEYTGLHSGLCTELFSNIDKPVKKGIKPIIWLLIIPVLAGLLLLVKNMT